MRSQSISPWEVAVHQGTLMGSGSMPLLIIGPVGSLQLGCAKEIHRRIGGGNFEHVMCTPDAAELRMQVLGPTKSPDADFADFDPDIPIGAMQRAIGGTLFLNCVDRCNASDTDWLRALLGRQQFIFNGRTVELDPSTRVIASVTDAWMEQGEYVVPQWLRAVFRDRVVSLEPLGDRPEEISGAIEWFSWHAAPEDQPVGLLWSDEAKELLVSRQWPGSYEELRRVVWSLASSIGHGEEITLDICRDHLAKYEGPGMKPIDNYRRQDCYNYARGLLYVGRSIGASEIYNWVEQFSRISGNRQFDPWLVGMRIVKGIANKYYYSSDRLRILIRDAYSSLCVELAEKGYTSLGPSVDPNLPLPSLQALLVNPLGPIKSAAGVLPHIAHLLGAGSVQQVVPVENVADRLKADDRLQVILFCDDFAGTGQQILSELVDTLASDEELKGVCEIRCRDGRPVVLGVVLAVAFAGALTKIRESGPGWLPVLAHSGERLEDGDRAFSATSTVFPEPELRAWAKTLVVDKAGSYLSPRWPGGFGNLQAMVVTADNAPNDSLPVICRSGSLHGIAWKALFERASSPLR